MNVQAVARRSYANILIQMGMQRSQINILFMLDIDIAKRKYDIIIVFTLTSLHRYPVQYYPSLLAYGYCAINQQLHFMLESATGSQQPANMNKRDS